MKTFSTLLFSLTSILLYNCTQTTDKTESKKTKKIIERKKPAVPVTYQFVKSKDWIKLHKTNPVLLHIVSSINRADPDHLQLMDSIIIPNDTTADLAYYMPFPVSVPALNDIDKIIFFSYATQAFAAYENGEMIHTGATNMGRKSDPTPTGLFFTNWKAEKTTSTFNDEWELKWNFNIENKLGVGWHQYEMPGYPASHSCLRLLEEDARYLYTWADQWVLNKKDEVTQKGTPVIVFGSYAFNGPKPWKDLIVNPRSLDIPAGEIEKIVAPYLSRIIAEQNKRPVNK